MPSMGSVSSVVGSAFVILPGSISAGVRVGHWGRGSRRGAARHHPRPVGAVPRRGDRAGRGRRRLADDGRGLRGRRRPAHLRPRRDRHRGCGCRRGRHARRRPATGAPDRRHRRARGAPGRPADRRATSRSISRTGRPGTGTSSAAVADVPWGSTASATARSPAGSARPRAARAVGGAVGRNPIGLLIPCHRVIAADGTHRRLRRRRLGQPRGPPGRSSGSCSHAKGVTVAGAGRLDSPARAARRGRPAGEFDDRRGCPAPAPSMFAVFRRRDFSLLWLAQLVSTAGSSLTDLAAGIFVWRADRIGPRGRPDPDRDGDPEPHRRPARRRLRRPARPASGS